MWVKWLYELDPLDCLKCKAQMRIIAFIQEPNSMMAVNRSLGLAEYFALLPLELKTRSVFDEQLCMDEFPSTTRNE